MKKNTILLFILLASSNIMFSQVKRDSLETNFIYAPGYFINNFSAEESWRIHKAAYVKQLKSKGLTDKEFKKSIVAYRNYKEKFFARVREQNRLAAIERKKDAIQRAKDAKQRAKDAIKRKKASERRALATIQRKKDAIQRAKDAKQREKDVIKRKKAEAQRKKSQEWRKNAENILIKNISLSNESNSTKTIPFEVTYKNTLRIGIRANVSSGIISIEIFNPKGIKEGELSLTFKSGADKEKEEMEYTSGALDKTILGAEVGEWKIKISSKKSEGSVAMSVAQYLKSTMDE